MRRLMDTEEKPLDALIGEKVTLLCAAYFYTGTLTGVNDYCVELTNPAIIYETGEWSKKEWGDAQTLPTKTLNITRQSIESFGVLK